MAAEIKELMEGKWQSYKMNDYGKYLETLGLEALLIKAVAGFKPRLKITVTGDVIMTSFSQGPWKSKAVFRLGEQYEVVANGIPSTAISWWSNGKLKDVITPKDPSKKAQIIVREIIEGQMFQSMTVDDVTATWVFKRVSSVDS